MIRRVRIFAAVLAGVLLAAPASAQCPPSTPGGLSAQGVCAGIELNWGNVSGANHYRVYRSLVNVQPLTWIAAPPASQYLDVTALPGVTYHYWITAVNTDCINPLNRESGARYTNASRGGDPATPTGVSASDGSYCTHVNVEWNPAAYATTYDVYRVPGIAGVELIGTTPLTQWNDTFALPGQSYSYSVVARNPCGASDRSGGNAGWRGGLPSTPTGVSASDGTNCLGVDVTWNASASATGYTVWRNIGDDIGLAVSLGVTSQTQWLDVTALPDVTYSYWVLASNACGVSEFSTPNSGERGELLAAPGDVAASDGGDCFAVRVTWSPVAGASNYTVWRTIDDDLERRVIIGTTANTEWNDFTALPGVEYSYWVRAVNQCGVGDYSERDHGTSGTSPARPQNLMAGSNADCVGIGLAWGGVAGALNYTVLRGLNNVLNEAVPIGTTPNTSWSDLTALPGTTYTYWVFAINLCGNSDPSNPAAASSGTIPAAPAGLNATNGSICLGVQLSWGVSVGALNYTVLRGLDSVINDAVPIGTTPNAAWTDITALPGTTYTYWVLAANACGVSGPSNPSTGRSGNEPAAPTGLAATDGTTCLGVEITWDGAADAIEYTVLRSPDGEFGGAIPVGTTPGTSWVDVSALPTVTYTYWVFATNLCGNGGPSGSDTGSRPLPLLLTGDPQAQSLNPCQSAQFTVAATGGGTRAYRWRRNGVPISDGPGGASPGGGTISGAATPTLTITGPKGGDEGAYSCVVSNDCVSLTSGSATLALCRPDVNCSGTLTVQDMFDFLALYFAGDARADFNNSGMNTVQDIFDFLAAYFAGCA